MILTKVVIITYITYTCLTKTLLGGRVSFSPLIIVPGFAGSREYFQSPTQAYPTLVWVSPYYIAETKKLTEYLRLQYNATSHTTYSPYGYQHVQRGWGETFTIERLSVDPGIAVTDYHHMIEKITKNKFYERGVNLRAAPYDFRKAPNEMSQFFDDLKVLLEETYKNNDNNRIVLLGHSLGCIYSLSFIKQMTSSWKKLYLKAFICVSGPLAGSVKSVLMETTGKSVVFFKSPLVFREFERTFPSTALLLPRAKYYTNRTLVQTLQRKYSARSYDDLFKDMGMDYGPSMYNDVKNLVDGAESPTGVDKVYCFHGAGLKTLESYSIKDFNDKKPVQQFGPGDGTVNQISLQLCSSWANVNYKVIDKVDHKKILHNDVFINKLMTILANK